ncbi:glucoamylase family protein [Flavihumibacter sp. CACIAM 22H1]|uniref:glucoamylase family protein n=1 Tax=Flavihumibacter sp. CACIAM 22H1 TaxID=1812911 RepID=UPI0007A8EDCA|nr:glucoamylase family protein [Flavihumibacter sp. CACIAM 22H1]KYP15660.1 MAG: beta-glucosidase [Flavihumibacter sp. CACIAM 22H1]
MKPTIVLWLSLMLLLAACGKSSGDSGNPAPVQRQVAVRSITIDGRALEDNTFDVRLQPSIRIQFTEPIDKQSVAGAIVWSAPAGGSAPVFTSSFQNNDSVLLITASSKLAFLTSYRFSLNNSIKSASGGRFISVINKTLLTSIDSSAKFPTLSDEALLTKVQQQTFRYFWDFGHPVSGMARERNSSGDIVTTGGTGFGIMAMLAAVERGFINRQQGLDRIKTIVNFLETKAIRYHGAFAHWINGASGLTQPFSQKDNGADLVETSFLMMGLLSARSYFDAGTAAETDLRSAITDLYAAVEWDWFRRDNGDQLYWHWSPDYGWDMNLPIRGWNECLVTYVLAAGSPTHAIPKSVYDKGWAREGAMKNGAAYYGISLPLGEPFGGPLFLSQYSFLGINPIGLKDAYADYELQNKHHAQINYQHSLENPKKYYGYSAQVWGLSASDIPTGYSASSPTNDLGVIAPTAALSSFPYTPVESMQALKFYYYTLGDKLFKDYGFIDAFALHQPWFADSFLAIDQGPIIVMIENYRTGLLWNLFTSAPEVKAALTKLGFTAPYL